MIEINEAAVDSFQKTKEIVNKGANRIELNSHLELGGLTPNLSEIKKTIDYLDDKKIPLVIMIRNRGGDFYYSKKDIEEMKVSIKHILPLIKGKDVSFTFGAVTKDGTGKIKLDTDVMSSLIKSTNNTNIVMHMAFDSINSKQEQKKALKWMEDNNIKRILTHGGSLSEDIEDTKYKLKELISISNKITILPGGGVNKENKKQLSKFLNVSELHGSKIV